MALLIRLNWRAVMGLYSTPAQPRRTSDSGRAYSVARIFAGGSMSLKGKHALITGSSRGIGRGIALKLAEQGVKVAVHYFQNERAAKETLAEVRKRGSDGFILQ